MAKNNELFANAHWRPDRYVPLEFHGANEFLPDFIGRVTIGGLDFFYLIPPNQQELPEFGIYDFFLGYFSLPQHFQRVDHNGQQIGLPTSSAFHIPLILFPEKKEDTKSFTGIFNLHFCLNLVGGRVNEACAKLITAQLKSNTTNYEPTVERLLLFKYVGAIEIEIGGKNLKDFILTPIALSNQQIIYNATLPQSASHWVGKWRDEAARPGADLNKLVLEHLFVVPNQLHYVDDLDVFVTFDSVFYTELPSQ